MAIKENTFFLHARCAISISVCYPTFYDCNIYWCSQFFTVFTVYFKLCVCLRLCTFDRAAILDCYIQYSITSIKLINIHYIHIGLKWRIADCHTLMFHCLFLNWMLCWQCLVSHIPCLIPRIIWFCYGSTFATYWIYQVIDITYSQQFLFLSLLIIFRMHACNVYAFRLLWIKEYTCIFYSNKYFHFKEFERNENYIKMRAFNTTSAWFVMWLL